MFLYANQKDRVERLFPFRFTKRKVGAGAPKSKLRRWKWQSNAEFKAPLLPEDTWEEFATDDGAFGLEVPYTLERADHDWPIELIPRTQTRAYYRNVVHAQAFQVSLVHLVFETDIQLQDAQSDMNEIIDGLNKRFPDHINNFKFYTSYEHEGVDFVSMQGSLSLPAEKYKTEADATFWNYQYLFMQSGKEKWVLGIVYDNAFINASSIATQIINSIAFDVELDLMSLELIGDEESGPMWETFTMADGIMSFESPLELTRLEQDLKQEGVLHAAAYTCSQMFDFQIHCGYQVAIKEHVKIEEAVEPMLVIYESEFLIERNNIRQTELTNFPVKAMLLEGDYEEHRSKWYLRTLVFAIGNSVWFLQARYTGNLEFGNQVFERIMESVRFNEGMLEDSLNRWLDDMK